MPVPVFKHVKCPSRDLKLLGVDWLLMFFVDLLGGRQLIEVVVSSEILIVKPDVFECQPYFPLV